MRLIVRAHFMLVQISLQSHLLLLLGILPAEFGRPTLLASIEVGADKMTEKWHFLASTARAGVQFKKVNFPPFSTLA